jgi:hypothetical protein
MRKHSASWIWREAKRRLRPLWLEPIKLQVEMPWINPSVSPRLPEMLFFWIPDQVGNDRGHSCTFASM